MQNTQLLDHALAGRSDEEKVRVLNLILKMGVSPEDEFWLIFIALGQVQILIEDIPPQLDIFRDRLDQWTESNLQTLAALAGEAKRMVELTTLLGELTITFKALSNAWEKSIPDSVLSETSFKNSVSTLQHENKLLSETLDLTRRSLTQQSSELSQRLIMLEKHLNDTTLQNARNGRRWPLWLMLGFLCLTQITHCTAQVGFNADIEDVLTKNSKRIEWLLEKQNRRDCAEGILSEDDPLCKAYN
ncbi:MAG: DUF6753 family protein [Cyanobacteria bacterium P01_H01_bin.152]